MFDAEFLKHWGYAPLKTESELLREEFEKRYPPIKDSRSHAQSRDKECELGEQRDGSCD